MSRWSAPRPVHIVAGFTGYRQRMDTARDRLEIEDAVDRLLGGRRPSFRQPPAPVDLRDYVSGDAPQEPQAPVEARIESDAALRRAVFFVPRHGGPDAAALRTRALDEGARRGGPSAEAPRAIPGMPRRGAFALAAGEGLQRRESFVELLDWRDLPDAAMPTALRSGYLALARTGWTYLRTGALGRLLRLNRAATLVAAARAGGLALQALLALSIGVIGGRTIAEGLSGLAAASGLPNWPVMFLAGFAGASAVILVLRICRARDPELLAYHAIRSLAYLSSRRGAYPAELDRRISAFAGRIGWALRQDVDEVLVVGHGDGAALAVSAVAEAVRWGDLPDGAPALSVLTLGQTIPLVGFLPEASRLRADLRDLSLREDVCWVDLSDPADARAYALSDPVAVCGVALDDRTGPLVLASSLGRLSGEGWRDRLAANPLALHDRYLDVPAKPARDFDWLRVLLGPLPLRTLLGGRPPAPGRIDVRGTAYAATARPRPAPEEDDD